MIRVKLQYEMNIFRNNFLKIPLIEDCNIVNEESSNKMICTIQVKENKNIKFIVYYLRNGYPKEIEELLSKIVMDDLYSVIFAPYISDNSARIIKNNDLGYMDFSGNCYFNRNLIHIHISGQKNEFVEKRKQKSIFERSSIVSSKILRTMLENPNKKWKLKELSNCVGCSIGQVSKVKEFLLNQSWIEQSSDGIRICKVAEVLKAWAVVYGKNNTMNYEYYTLENIANVEACLQQLKNEEGIEYFLTGFSGGVRYQPVVRYNKIHCYVNPKDISRIIEHLECKKVDSGANLVFIVPYDECVLMNSRIINNSSVVSAIQAFLDCMNLKGRGEELAEEILVREIDTYER